MAGDGPRAREMPIAKSIIAIVTVVTVILIVAIIVIMINIVIIHIIAVTASPVSRIRPVLLLRVWISGGLTQADS